VCQFGLSGTPALQQHYCNDITCSAAAIAAGAAVEPDTGPLVGKNVKFTVSFSLMATGGNASVEIFINLGNNSRLDQDGFRPFGEVRNDASSRNVVQQIYHGYGELNESDVCRHPRTELCRGPVLKKILAEGNDYLNKSFPLMTYITQTEIVAEGEHQVWVWTP